jgi:hypothetical protein
MSKSKQKKSTLPIGQWPLPTEKRKNKKFKDTPNVEQDELFGPRIDAEPEFNFMHDPFMWTIPLVGKIKKRARLPTFKRKINFMPDDDTNNNGDQFSLGKKMPRGPKRNIISNRQTQNTTNTRPNVSFDQLQPNVSSFIRAEEGGWNLYRMAYDTVRHAVPILATVHILPSFSSSSRI